MTIFDTLLLPAILAFTPGVIVYELSRYFMLGQHHLIGGTQPQQLERSLRLDNVVSAFLATATCLLVLAVIVLAGRKLLPDFPNLPSALNDTTTAGLRDRLRIFHITILLATLFWSMFLFHHIVAGAIKSELVRSIVECYVFIYIALTILSSGSTSILKVLSYGLGNSLGSLFYGPVFIADQIAKSSQLERWLTFVFAFFILFSTQKYIANLILGRYKRKAGADAFDLNAINVAVDAFIWLFSILFSVSTLQIDVVGVGIFTALVGAGVSISFRDLLNNFFSGILLTLDTSLKKGDVIRTPDGVVGEVNQISLRYTQLSTKDNVDILIPNSALVQGRFENLTRTQEEVRLSLRLLVESSEKIDKVEKSILRACRRVPEVAGVAGRTSALFYIGASERGHQFDLRFWVNDPRPGPPKLQSDVAKAIYKQFEQDKIKMPRVYLNIRDDSLAESETDFATSVRGNAARKPRKKSSKRNVVRA